jgi:hypothetical protein
MFAPHVQLAVVVPEFADGYQAFPLESHGRSHATLRVWMTKPSRLFVMCASSSLAFGKSGTGP